MFRLFVDNKEVSQDIQEVNMLVKSEYLQKYGYTVIAQDTYNVHLDSNVSEYYHDNY